MCWTFLGIMPGLPTFLLMDHSGGHSMLRVLLINVGFKQLVKAQICRALGLSKAMGGGGAAGRGLSSDQLTLLKRQRKLKS